MKTPRFSPPALRPNRGGAPPGHIPSPPIANPFRPVGDTPPHARDHDTLFGTRLSRVENQLRQLPSPDEIPTKMQMVEVVDKLQRVTVEMGMRPSGGRGLEERLEALERRVDGPIPREWMHEMEVRLSETAQTGERLQLRVNSILDTLGVGTGPTTALDTLACRLDSIDRLLAEHRALLNERTPAPKGNDILESSRLVLERAEKMTGMECRLERVEGLYKAKASRLEELHEGLQARVDLLQSRCDSSLDTLSVRLDDLRCRVEDHSRAEIDRARLGEGLRDEVAKMDHRVSRVERTLVEEIDGIAHRLERLKAPDEVMVKRIERVEGRCEAVDELRRTVDQLDSRSLARVLEEASAHHESMARRLDEMDARVSAADGYAESFSHVVEEATVHFTRRLGNMEGWVKDRLEKVTGDSTQLEGQYQSVQHTLSELTHKVASIIEQDASRDSYFHKWVSEMDNHLASATDEINRSQDVISERLGSLESQVDSISHQVAETESKVQGQGLQTRGVEDELIKLKEEHERAVAHMEMRIADVDSLKTEQFTRLADMVSMQQSQVDTFVTETNGRVAQLGGDLSEFQRLLSGRVHELQASFDRHTEHLGKMDARGTKQAEDIEHLRGNLEAVAMRLSEESPRRRAAVEALSQRVDAVERKEVQHDPPSVAALRSALNNLGVRYEQLETKWTKLFEQTMQNLRTQVSGGEQASAKRVDELRRATEEALGVVQREMGSLASKVEQQSPKRREEISGHTERLASSINAQMGSLGQDLQERLASVEKEWGGLINRIDVMERERNNLFSVLNDIYQLLSAQISSKMSYPISAFVEPRASQREKHDGTSPPPSTPSSAVPQSELAYSVDVPPPPNTMKEMSGSLLRHVQVRETIPTPSNFSDSHQLSPQQHTQHLDPQQLPPTLHISPTARDPSPARTDPTTTPPQAHRTASSQLLQPHGSPAHHSLLQQPSHLGLSSSSHSQQHPPPQAAQQQQQQQPQPLLSLQPHPSEQQPQSQSQTQEQEQQQQQEPQQPVQPPSQEQMTLSQQQLSQQLQQLSMHLQQQQSHQPIQASSQLPPPPPTQPVTRLGMSSSGRPLHPVPSTLSLFTPESSLLHMAPQPLHTPLDSMATPPDPPIDLATAATNSLSRILDSLQASDERRRVSLGLASPSASTKDLLSRK